MADMFEIYRPFRNRIRSFRLVDTLAVVRAYSQNLAYGVPFAQDLEVLPRYRDPAAGIKQWELEIIARDAIAHAPQHLYTSQTLRQRHRMAILLNQLRDVEGHIAAETVHGGNVLTELHRIGHRQFEWQSDLPNGLLLLRYYKIFSKPALDAIVTQQIGLNTRALHLVGMLLNSAYMQWFALHYPPNLFLSDRNNVNVQEIDAFLGHFARPVVELSQRIRVELADNMNENYAYFFNSLRAYPLIDMNVDGRRSLVAPLPALMSWRYTRGLYYELFAHPRFAQTFGAAFQAYVGDILADLFTDSHATVLPEEPTANNRGIASSDWFLILHDAAMLVEAKTKRMGLAAKITLNDTVQLERELGILADGILQTYKCIDAIQRGAFVGQGYEPLRTKRFYPVIVTLESWHVFGPTWRRLNDLVQQRLHRAGLPANWTDSMPFTACDINEFELLTRAIQHTDAIGSILDERLASEEYKQYELYNYLCGHQQSAIQNARELFPNQFTDLFS